MEILKGKGAVVTGAASGIGKAIATAFVEAGASVLLCDVNAKGLETVTRELGERAIGRVTDVSDENQVEAAAKAGVDMLTRCGALELGPRGLRVVGIAPGLVETPLTRHKLEDPAIRELFMAVIPMKRAVHAEEIAGTALFLASDHARSINGETIAVDGGLLTRGTPALLSGVKKAS
jgi:NAD(P)-dependent dehydrogenase (short-subunit alcohol dehydrogenase family)